MSTFTGFFAMLREVFRQRDVVVLVVLAAVLYGFYYPAPYAHQQARAVPIAVVDDEGTSLTRHLAAAINASKEVAIIARPADMAAGQDMLLNRDVEALLVIPQGMTRAALRGEGPRLALWVNGIYLVRAKAVGEAIESAFRATLEEKATPYVGRRDVSPPVIDTARFNPGGGYANYIFPAVTPVILQQTMLFGAAVLLALRRQRGKPPLPDYGELVGGWLALSVLSVIGALLYYGWFFAMLGLPGQAGPGMLMVIAAAQGMAIGALGCAIGSLFHKPETALFVLIPTSLPIFFLTGATWPREAMPEWVALLGSLFPATHGARALLLADQMGAPARAIAPSLGALLLLTLLYLGVSAATMRKSIVHDFGA